MKRWKCYWWRCLNLSWSQTSRIHCIFISLYPKALCSWSSLDDTFQVKLRWWEVRSDGVGAGVQMTNIKCSRVGSDSRRRRFIPWRCPVTHLPRSSLHCAAVALQRTLPHYIVLCCNAIKSWEILFAKAVRQGRHCNFLLQSFGSLLLRKICIFCNQE